MITLDSWVIESPENVDFLAIKKSYDNAYIGTELTLDDRLKWIEQYSRSIAESTASVRYDSESAELVFEEKRRYSVNDLDQIEVSSRRVFFDATSLLLPELLYLMDWADRVNQDFDVIYVEPDGYAKDPYKSKIGSHSPDYSLSEDGSGLCMLPRYVLPMDRSHLVVGLGYEGHRFGVLLISDEINPDNITGVLGVPPFELGWEKNSYSKNYSFMDDARKNYDASFIPTAANDPLQNYQLLSVILRSEMAMNRRGRGINLAPIGTKPSALGMAWFAINNKGTGVLYDFIRKKPRRTEGVGKVHFWKFSTKG